ncbi:DUF3108 domain-containing protein [Paraburkholderia sp.]|uniref:DUF3108 domain-containing protein n=1 Tax=Paraburkholderia sp. TaxID=1926495 RepID=UPI0025CFE3CD|nr:DUF3108 domain-containing protein [Paraburkholderia sp.]
MPTATAPIRPERTGSDQPRSARAWRWVAVFIAVAILHGLAVGWFERHRDVAPPASAAHVPVQVALLKPARIEREAPPATAAAAPKPATHRVRHTPHDAHALHAITPPGPHRPPRPHPKVPAEPPASSAAATTAPSDDAAASSAAASASPGGSTNAASDNGNTPSAPAASASHGVKFSVPPSGDLQYDTFYNGVRNQPGTIHWKSDAQHYEMVVSVPLPFVGTLSWTSRGRVDAFGLAPDQYIEKRGHRPSDVTVFNRNDKQIVFTRTPNSLALPDGAQDRFSMVMQLASLVRGDPGTYQPGVTRAFYVADNDSGEDWPVTTIGDETVQTNHGFVTARHFMRLPRHEGDKRRIDVWLAPSLDWLPVRLVQTEPNGTEFELLWRGALASPASNEASKPGSGDVAGDVAGDTASAAAPAMDTAPADASATAPGDTASEPSAPPAASEPVAPAPAASEPVAPSSAATTPQPPDSEAPTQP